MNIQELFSLRNETAGCRVMLLWIYWHVKEKQHFHKTKLLLPKIRALFFLYPAERKGKNRFCLRWQIAPPIGCRAQYWPERGFVPLGGSSFLQARFGRKCPIQPVYNTRLCSSDRL